MKIKVDVELEVPDEVGEAMIAETPEDQPQAALSWPVPLDDGYSYNVSIPLKWVKVE